MRRALQFSPRSEDAPSAGALFPATREEFEDISRGRDYRVSGESYSGLKRLGEDSSIFFWVTGDPDGASVFGVFRLRQRPLLDCDDDGEYYTTVALGVGEQLPSITESTFRSVVSDIFTTPTEFFSDLTEVQTNAILNAMLARERPSATFATANSSRRGSVYEAPYYDSRYRRQQLPRWDAAERGMYESEIPWPVTGYGPPPDHHRRLPPSDRWRAEHVAYQRTNEPETRPPPPLSLKDVGIQTDQDERLIEAEELSRGLAAENEQLRADGAAKAAEKEALEGVLQRLRLTLFRQFHVAGFGTEDESSDRNPAHAESDHREAAPPVENRQLRTESPRSPYTRQYSPPPLETGSRYSPVPTRDSSHHQELTNRSMDEPPLPVDAILPPPIVTPSVNPAPNVPSAPTMPPASTEVQPAVGVVGHVGPNSTSRLPQYVQPPPAFSYLPPPVQPQWSPAAPMPYYTAGPQPPNLPPPLNSVPPRPTRPSPNGIPQAAGLQTPPPVAPVSETMALMGGVMNGAPVSRVGNPSL